MLKFFDRIEMPTGFLLRTNNTISLVDLPQWFNEGREKMLEMMGSTGCQVTGLWFSNVDEPSGCYLLTDVYNGYLRGKGRAVPLNEFIFSLSGAKIYGDAILYYCRSYQNQKDKWDDEILDLPLDEEDVKVLLSCARVSWDRLVAGFRCPKDEEERTRVEEIAAKIDFDCDEILWEECSDEESSDEYALHCEICWKGLEEEASCVQCGFIVCKGHNYLSPKGYCPLCHVKKGGEIVFK